MWWVLLTCGLRPSEALALQWDDLEWHVDDDGAGQFRVWRSLTRLKGKGWKLTPLKSDRSRAGKRKSRQQRWVPVPPDTMEVLAGWREQQREEAEIVGNPKDLIFTTTEGTPLHLSNLHAGPFNRIMAEADRDGDLGEWGPEPVKPAGEPGPKARREFTPALRIYDLRHTFASHMLDVGMPIHVLSEILGHSDTDFTRQTYVHVLPKQKQESARYAQQVFGRSDGGDVIPFPGTGTEG